MHVHILADHVTRSPRNSLGFFCKGSPKKALNIESPPCVYHPCTILTPKSCSCRITPLLLLNQKHLCFSFHYCGSKSLLTLKLFKVHNYVSYHDYLMLLRIHLKGKSSLETLHFKPQCLVTVRSTHSGVSCTHLARVFWKCICFNTECLRMMGDKTKRMWLKGTTKHRTSLCLGGKRVWMIPWLCSYWAARYSIP